MPEKIKILSDFTEPLDGGALTTAGDAKDAVAPGKDDSQFYSTVRKRPLSPHADNTDSIPGNSWQH